MTAAIVSLCAAFVAFVMPISLASIFDPNVTQPYLYLIAFLLYWNQYSVNFVIYSARSDTYRTALKGLFCLAKRRAKAFVHVKPVLHWP